MRLDPHKREPEEHINTEQQTMPSMNLQETPKSETTTKQKERHIVTWTQQEDDILREQINLHGTENWAIIASKFKDKTTRQCRRRWYTYLNSECKKGGWSPEEDMILCEAQKIFGNRWTEISKVVSGRTDNAVKNRFSTLCKKRAKHEALSKENNASYINPNNKRIIFQDGLDLGNESADSTAPCKKLRTYISDLSENSTTKRGLTKECGVTKLQQIRPPFAVLVQNFHNVDNLPPKQHVSNKNQEPCKYVVGNNKAQGTFLRRDDPKITALKQQAELLSSLALKVNTENTNQSLENAWKELQDFLNQTKEGDLNPQKISEMDFLLEDFKDLLEDLKSSNLGSAPSMRQPDFSESPGSSEYSTGSTVQSHAKGDKTEQPQTEICSPDQYGGVGPMPIHKEIQNSGRGCEDGTCSSITQAGKFLSCNELKDNDGVVFTLAHSEFSSPLQVTPLFQSLAAGIPSPKFSESERNFLLKTLGIGSPSPNPSTNPSQPPPCRRALLHSL
ncbi:PREDICTED: transcription factor RAX2-like isoform X3 [Nelumbo nucifera]|uniref:Transcription factor RAX2-like isoform X3 n=1 Tax=Nelumbo nucifera TaxID=4432 RepID=A0A1U7YWR6_NELNU|nr:PREDICTED: transcription factor RAX2-like isoform X3 [Nelumbo nucifera]